MIAKYLEMLAGFIVDAFCKKLGVENLDDLATKLAKAAKAELADDLAKLDDLPQKLAATVAAQLASLVQEVTALPAQMLAAINQFNPFKR